MAGSQFAGFGVSDVGLVGTGITEATDYPILTPDGSPFVCATKRATRGATFGGIQIRIVDPGVTEQSGPVGSGSPSTLRAWLVVEGVRYDPDTDTDKAFPISDELLLADHNAGPLYLASAFDVLELTSDGLNTLQPGDKVRVVYMESGGLGVYDPSGEVGTRPTFMILSWPLVAVED